MRRERGDEQGKVISLFSALAKATSGVEAVSQSGGGGGDRGRSMIDRVIVLIAVL